MTSNARTTDARGNSRKPEDGFLAEFNLPMPPPPRVRVPTMDRLSPEEQYAIEEGRRQKLVLMIESGILALGQMTVTQLSELSQRQGMQLIWYTQRTMEEASRILNPAYLQRFERFSDHSLESGLRGLLQIQYLSVDLIMDIVDDSPNLKRLPPEKKGLIRTFFHNLFGRGR